MFTAVRVVKKIITHFFPESKPNIPVRSETRVGKADFFEGAGGEGASRPSDGAGGAARVAEKNCKLCSDCIDF